MELSGYLALCPLVAILRGVKPDEVVAIVAALASEGIFIVEVPLNSPDPLISITRVQERFGADLLVGAGTVMSEADVHAVHHAGGRLVVTPHADTAVVRATKARGMIACPGFATPTEAFANLAAGADALKLFPAELATPAVLRAIRAVLPTNTMVLPVGGIGPDSMTAWRDAGAAGFGIGSSIYKPGDTPDIVAAKARALLAGLR